MNKLNMPEVSEKLAKLIEKRNERPEIGSIWNRRSKKTGREYLTMQVTFTKEQLTRLLEQVTDNESVKLNLVSFPNKANNGDYRKPSFKIYEELDFV